MAAPGRGDSGGVSFVNLSSPLTQNLGSAAVVSTSERALPSADAAEDFFHTYQPHSSSLPAAKPEVPVIDWQGSSLGPLDQHNVVSPKATSDWLDDFLNHLGKTEAQRNPNAGIRIRPTSSSAVR